MLSVSWSPALLSLPGREQAGQAETGRGETTQEAWNNPREGRGRPRAAFSNFSAAGILSCITLFWGGRGDATLHMAGCFTAPLAL